MITVHGRKVKSMKANKVSDFEDKPNPHKVSAKTIYDHEEAQCVHILLKPGESLKKHITPVNVFFYILEGDGQVEIGDEIVTVSKDMIVESPVKIPHRLLNPSSKNLRFLVVKVPKPKEGTKVV
jgi:mannose-6-phosphate isomerase-like protein (cupin superfamily)